MNVFWRHHKNSSQKEAKVEPNANVSLETGLVLVRWFNVHVATDWGGTRFKSQNKRGRNTAL